MVHSRVIGRLLAPALAAACFLGAARPAPAQDVLDIAEYRGLYAYSSNVEPRAIPQFAVCYNSVNDEYFVAWPIEVAFDGTNFMTAFPSWESTSDGHVGPSGMYAARFDDAGRALGGRFLVASTPEEGVLWSGGGSYGVQASIAWLGGAA